MDSQKKIKILYIVPEIGDGGIETMIYDWMSSIDNSLFAIDLLTQKITSQRMLQKIKTLGCSVYCINSRNRNVLKNCRYITDLLKISNYDMVHMHTCFAPEFYFLLCAKKCNVGVRIIHGHNVITNKNFKDYMINRLSVPFMRKFATHYLACSDDAGIEIVGVKGIKSNKYEKIINGIDTNKFSFNPQMRINMRFKLKLEDKYVIGNIGRLTDQKNQIFLLDIFKEVVKYIPNAVLIIIGDGELKNDLISKSKELGILEKVLFVGIVDNVQDYLSAMDHFVFPSKYEGFGLALLEAQANGLACTVSDRIVKDAIVLDTTNTLGLDIPTEEWAKSIRNNYATKRENAAEIIRNRGYDIKDNNLNNFYIKIIHEDGKYEIK